MYLGTSLRGFRAITMMLAIAALALAPASADAASKGRHASKNHLKKASKPAKRAAARKPTASETGLGDKLDLAPTLQLAAMNTAIKAAPTFFSGLSTGCTFTTAMLTSQSGSIMAGNFRDGDGNCYVWLNLQQSSMLTGKEICKTTLHEMGHLNGLAHSPDPADVMYAPFVADPIPAPCGGPKQL
jgi:hypothetical protein